MKGAILICEGRTDVSFLIQLLTSNGYQAPDNLTLGKLPSPLNGHFSTVIQNYDYDNHRLQLGPRLPSILVKNAQGKKYLIIYAIDGTGKLEEAKNLVSNYRTLISTTRELARDTIELSLGLMFDSDAIGETERNEWINSAFEGVLGSTGDLLAGYAHSDFQKIQSHIISGENGLGVLEDILLPLYEQQDKINAFDKAEYFLSECQFTRPIPSTGTPNTEKMRVDKMKSKIAIVNQLQVSGLSNADSIRKANDWKRGIATSEKCGRIIQFINQLLR